MHTLPWYVILTPLTPPSSTEFDRNARPPRSSEDDIVSRSGSPTPRNSPRTARAILMGMYVDSSNSSSGHAAGAASATTSAAIAASGQQHGGNVTAKPALATPSSGGSTSAPHSLLHHMSAHQQHQQQQQHHHHQQQQQQQQQLMSQSLHPSTHSMQPLLGSNAIAAAGNNNSNSSRPASVISTSQHSMLLSTLVQPNSLKLASAKYADSLERQSVVSSTSTTDLNNQPEQQPAQTSASSSNHRSSVLYDSVGGGGSGGGGDGAGEPRLLTITTNKNTNLGIRLMGGNAVGIYVHYVQKGSLAEAAGMREGDQIVEYNGADLRRVTAEQAANEISRPAEKVLLVVQHDLKSEWLYLCSDHSFEIV